MNLLIIKLNLKAIHFNAAQSYLKTSSFLFLNIRLLLHKKIE